MHIIINLPSRAYNHIAVIRRTAWPLHKHDMHKEKMVQFTTCRQEQLIVSSITQNLISEQQQQLYIFFMPQQSAAKNW